MSEDVLRLAKSNRDAKLKSLMTAAEKFLDAEETVRGHIDSLIQDRSAFDKVRELAAATLDIRDTREKFMQEVIKFLETP